MARWDHGYVTDVVYTSNFYRETTPAWIATTALLMGHRPPVAVGPVPLRRPGLRQRLHRADRRGHQPAGRGVGLRLQPRAYRNRARPGGSRGPGQRAFRRDLLRRPRRAAARGAAGVRLHRVAWRDQLDLAGQPPLACWK